MMKIANHSIHILGNLKVHTQNSYTSGIEKEDVYVR